MVNQGERLQKVLAQAGIASRRACEELITAGRVKVNGATVRELGVRAAPGDRIEVDGQPLRGPQKPLYVLLYKPAGCVTTAKDPEGRKTVLDFLSGLGGRVFPVGRLDYETSGALVLTNDGDLSNMLMHPRYGVTKVYEAVVAGRPKDGVLQTLRDGIELDGAMTSPCEVAVLGTDGRTTRLVITLHEGRNRQVRRMLESVHHACLRLTRVRYGDLTLRGLRPGAWRYLRSDEIVSLRKAATQGRPFAERRRLR